MSTPTLPWPGPDEGRVIAEMLADPTSTHWDNCYVCMDAMARSPAMRHRFSILKHDDIAGKMADITMERVRASLASFRQECRLRSFLATILTREVINYLRRRRLVTTSLTPSGAERPLAEPAAPVDIEHLVELHELHRRVLDAIHLYVASRKNPSRAAHILDLWLDGVSAQEIAERLGVPYQIVMNTIHRLRKVLRRLLADWNAIAPALQSVLGTALVIDLPSDDLPDTSPAKRPGAERATPHTSADAPDDTDHAAVQPGDHGAPNDAGDSGRSDTGGNRE